MSLVLATVLVCLTASGQCESHQLRVEERACGLSLRAEVPVAGQWSPGSVKVVCSRGPK